MSRRRGQGGNLQHVVSRGVSLHIQQNHTLTCDVQKAACKLPPTLCLGITITVARFERSCSARRGGRGCTSPNEQATYKRVARP